MQVWLLLLLPVVASFYLPGVAPHEYEKGDPVAVKVNSIKSTETAIPYDMYSLMVCYPEKSADGKLLYTTTKSGKVKVRGEAENLGEILWGDAIKPSRYNLRMQVDVPCQKVCTTKPKPTNVEKKTGISIPLKRLKKRIDEGYRGHLILDNLPVSEVYIWESGVRGLFYRRGYPLGVPGNRTSPSIVYNHLAFTVKYHKPEDLPGWRIVGFEVVPYSINSAIIDSTCKTGEDFEVGQQAPQLLTITPPSEAPKALSWSYSVKWEEDPEVAWSSRWDHYLRSSDASAANIHWFAIVNSLMIVLCLSGMVAMIMLRALHKDFNRYNNPDNEDEAQEETGWKLVHGQVFRKPVASRMLAVFVGSGAQLFGMSGVTMIIAMLGFLSPARRGSLMTAMLVLYALMGSLGGFVTAMLANMFDERSWRTIFTMGFWVPGKAFGVFFVVNLMLWTQGAATAIPFGWLAGLVALWFFVSLPLVVFGGASGYRLAALQHPIATAAIPRGIPAQRLTMHPLLLVLCAGAVPFGAVFIELYFILSSLWLNKFYYVFGFLGIVFVILAVTCAEISIVLVYFQLCYEDYRWWWRSFWYAGSSGLYLFLYSIYYFATNLNMHSLASIILYFGYMGLLAYVMFLVTGTVGFVSSLVFVRYIYGRLRVD
eukprot:TRINITY_DN5903_c0_g1_i1.p1 TRINITY_DN5903_c0_g1~~TRINITY_DN5903_c0_g1_i1.p1  ORF type:complete len:670 (-),score=192.10 TRINITY_DN5903_c0_g1_i1:80-2035(-)